MSYPDSTILKGPNIPRIIKKRLDKELPLLEKFGEVRLEYKEYPENVHIRYHYNYEVHITIHSKHLIVKIPNDYPFKPPKLFINEQNYIQLLCFNNKMFNNEFLKEGIKCLCCETILCGNSWRPDLTIEKLIDEYLCNQKIINKILRRLYVPEICYINNIFCDSIIARIQRFI